MNNEPIRINDQNRTKAEGLPISWFVSGGLLVLSLFVYTGVHVAHLA